MRILSWDIGINNLAYCFLEYNKNDKYIKILKWDIIDLLSNYRIPTNFCIKCNKKASLQFNEQTYCKIHARNINGCININKPICQGINSTCKKKPQWRNIQNGQSWCNIHKPGEHKLLALTINLTPFEMGKNIKQKLDNIFKDEKIDIVLIENQPSLKNPTMKTIQVMVLSYFSMYYNKPELDLLLQDVITISATNKLHKKIDKMNELENELKQNGLLKGNKYIQRKTLSTYYCEKWLNNFNEPHDHNNCEWINFFKKNKKRDDLADCLLQCLAWIH